MIENVHIWDAEGAINFGKLKRRTGAVAAALACTGGLIGGPSIVFVEEHLPIFHEKMIYLKSDHV